MAKTKITMFLDSDLIKWLDMNRDEETSRSALVRILIRQEQKRRAKRKSKTSTEVKVDDFFNTAYLAPQFIPDDLKDYSGLLIEWWAIRYKNKGTCTKNVFDRIIKKLRSFHIQDRKQALENAITGGWKDLFPIKKSKFVEEPKNNHPASRVFTAERGFE